MSGVHMLAEVLENGKNRKTTNSLRPHNRGRVEFGYEVKAAA